MRARCETPPSEIVRTRVDFGCQSGPRASRKFDRLGLTDACHAKQPNHRLLDDGPGEHYRG